MTTKRREKPSVEPAERDRAGKRLRRAQASLEALEQQAALCEWIDIVRHRMGPIKEEIAAIGALVRDHNHARVHQIEVGFDTPEFVAASKAVFAILHVVDRAAEMKEELGAAAIWRDQEVDRLTAATARLEEEQAQSKELAARRWPPWGKAARLQARRVAADRAASEVAAGKAALEEANDVFQPLAAEADMLNIELSAFARINGGTPEEVYQRVEEHRQQVKAARAGLALIESEISERTDALELQLRSDLEQAQQWGLISAIPDGVEAMADGLEQTGDVAVLETSRIDCQDLKRQIAAAAAIVGQLQSASA